MHTILIRLVSIFCVCSTVRADLPESISTNDISGGGSVRLVGPLGHPLGAYLTVEGVPCAVGMGGGKKYSSKEDILKFGIHSLEIHKVNGIAINPPITLSCFGNVKFEPAEHYILRGFQHGMFGPSQPDIEMDGDADLPQVGYSLKIYFVPTKVLREYPK